MTIELIDRLILKLESLKWNILKQRAKDNKPEGDGWIWQERYGFGWYKPLVYRDNPYLKDKS